MKTKHILPLAVVAGAALLPTMGLAQDAAPSFDEIGPYIMTTLLFCMAGFLVFFMAAASRCSRAALSVPRTSRCR
jgi:Amt family ammonium transporter